MKYIHKRKRKDQAGVLRPYPPGESDTPEPTGPKAFTRGFLRARVPACGAPTSARSGEGRRGRHSSLRTGPGKLTGGCGAALTLTLTFRFYFSWNWSPGAFGP